MVRHALIAGCIIPYSVGGIRVTGLRAEQIGLTTVNVNWTRPSLGPSRIYRISVGNSMVMASGNSHNIMVSLPPGNHAVRVLLISQHLPNEEAAASVMLRGKISDCT